MNKKKTDNNIVSNKQAYRDYFIDKKYEAGIELLGNEVKSLRLGKANLKGSFAKLENGEVLLYNMHIDPYKFSRDDVDPIRPRKLLLHKIEIKQLFIQMEQKGLALLPLRLYFRRGYAKVELAIGRGKRMYDKRASLKEKQAKREVEKALKHKGNI